MPEIIVLGSLNMDLVISATKLPVLGETVHGEGFMTAPGGKGANQAVAAARLGGNVHMAGCAGDDVFGEQLIRNLKENGVDAGHVRQVRDVPTGTAVIVIHQGDNFIILDAGANACVNGETVKQAEALLGPDSILVLQLEVPLDAVVQAIDAAKRRGAKVLLNPAPAVKLDDRVLSRLDILVANETECEILTGIPADTVEKAKEAVQLLHAKGIPQAVITLGSHGAVYNRGSEAKHRPVPDRKIEVVDTTAAGDSFIGALTVALSAGQGIDEAMAFAVAAASITVTRKGAQTSLPDLEEVRAFLRG